ncbi:hypothetical protein ACFV4F_20650 [Kitasatospora sp. NPDC059722]|uniref:hypothetical protein n=1 Tax=Kitasatospora sp. NPDC059722 TaxID=3346925 RepID=UPI0036B9BF8D
MATAERAPDAPAALISARRNDDMKGPAKGPHRLPDPYRYTPSMREHENRTHEEGRRDCG